MERFSQPCRHETSNLPDSVRVRDYHPLTKSEIANLLVAALDAIRRQDTYTVFDIGKRLEQGIPGQTCPRAKSGKPAEMYKLVTSLYDRMYQSMRDARVIPEDADPYLVDRLYSLMQC